MDQTLEVTDEELTKADAVLSDAEAADLNKRRALALECGRHRLKAKALLVAVQRQESELREWKKFATTVKAFVNDLNCPKCGSRLGGGDE